MRSRPLIILITVCILICSVFVVSSSAASSENLIESDLTQWDQLPESLTIDTVNKGNIYRLSSTSNSSGFFLGIVYDLPNFVAGHSYTLKFCISSASDITSAWGVSYTNDNIISHYKNATVIVGYGYLNPSGTSIESQVDLFQFDSSNISKYIGKTLTSSFVAGSSSGTPVLFITIHNDDGAVHHYFFSDFVMYDNDDNSGELKGIKGFLHSIRWDIVGGICDDDDCPHSSDVNPHRSLTERMTIGFQNLFETIASKFEEGSTLNTWFNGLASKVTNLGSSIDSFISRLSSGITSNFDSLGIDLEGWFGDTVDSIDSFFEGLWKKFDEFFDKFKPRVYERFKWRPGDINESTGDVVLKEDGYPYAIVTDFFTVEPGTGVYLNFKASSEVSHLSVFQYDYYGNFICEKISSSGSLEDYQLPEGFLYRFRVIYSSSDIELGNINQYVRVYADEGWIMMLLHAIENFNTGLVNLVLYFDWDGDYENPFVEELPFVTFLRSFLADLAAFINNSIDRFLTVKVKMYSFNILFSYVLEEIPILILIGAVSLFLVVVSRFVGI